MQHLLPGIPIVESPLFHSMLDSLDLSSEERRIALDLHDRGYAVMEFPDEEVEARIERIKTNLAPRFGIDFADPAAIKNQGANRRVQDAWLFDEDVKAIAINSRLLDLLSRLYGRRPVPFQTLNFPVGTEQHLHSDSNHFSSIPERFMCGVWLAMEDVHADAGPLTYLPGSHKWPILTNIMVGRRAAGNASASAQAPFEKAWREMVAQSGQEQEILLARKGQALIWSANLLHGGSLQLDPTRTRWSQVSHYYFEDCIYYTPGHSDEPIGRLDLRSITNIATGEIEPNRFLGEELDAAQAKWCSPPARENGFLNRLGFRKSSEPAQGRLPADFDAATYLRLNSDVEAAGVEPGKHFLQHGRGEGRAYRLG